ncbi:MAG TPA: ABC transporter permease [Streptosporangiaceae bacterium]|nr:ABC transporter permease [Streptosporangiaceae bacterium]
MSAADLTGPPPAGPPPAGPPPAPGAARPLARVAGRPPDPARAWLRLLRSELGLTFGRWRNIALLGVLAVIPVLLGVALKLAGPTGGGQGPPFLDQVAGNGIFLSFLALTVMLTLVLPLTVAVVAGDSVAGEAGHGTLRYLLAVPAGRTRLLGVKYVALLAFCLAGALVVAAVSLVVGAAAFGAGPVTLLSGTTIPLAAGLGRLLLVTLYVAAAMGALAAIGLAASTLTEHAIAAIAAILVLVIGSEVTDNVPQFAVVHPYLPTHWWLSFDGLLRAPVAGAAVGHGLASFAAYAVIFGAIAWARFTTADITS